MNRRTIIGIILAISLLLNIVLFVFAYIQKIAADAQRKVAVESEAKYLEQSRQAKVQLDLCEGLRAQCDETRTECEQRLLTLSNRK